MGLEEIDKNLMGGEEGEQDRSNRMGNIVNSV